MLFLSKALRPSKVQDEELVHSRREIYIAPHRARCFYTYYEIHYTTIYAPAWTRQNFLHEAVLKSSNSILACLNSSAIAHTADDQWLVLFPHTASVSPAQNLASQTPGTTLLLRHLLAPAWILGINPDSGKAHGVSIVSPMLGYLFLVLLLGNKAI